MIILGQSSARTTPRATAHLIANAIALCLALLVAIPAPSYGGDRRKGVAIGLGVAGGIVLLNKLVKAKKERGERGSSFRTKSYRSTAKKSFGTATSKTSKASKSRPSQIETAAVPTDEAIPAGPPKASAPSALAKDASAAKDAASKAPAILPPSTAPGLIAAPAEIKAAQEHLKFMGYDVPQASGVLDLKTKIAIMQFQDSIGAPSTGQMTVEQLRSLFRKASEQQARKN